MINFPEINLSYFVDIVRRDHPDWPLTAQYWQARRMLERHPKIERAYYAGIDNGRDLRERMEHGLGVWWKELEPLTPEERGFVLALVREEIGTKGTDAQVLEVVQDKRKEEEREEREDALAADWREKSDRPDSRVTQVKPFSEKILKASR